MKKLLAILLAIVMIFCFVGCKTEDDVTVKELEKIGFIVIDKIGDYGDSHIYLIYDDETKFEYIFVTGFNRTSLCPYYGDDGKIAIYEGE